nr:2Fe-2S iron-sulfur cluster binding domain-containing protein [Natronobeatus ordinarius]
MSGADSSDADDHAVDLVWRDGTEKTITVAAGDPIVDAAERARVSLPYGCRYGACGTCLARVLEGEVVHLEPPRGLKDGAREQGFVLACIATPESDCRLRVGHDVQAEVMGTPWK